MYYFRIATRSLGMFPFQRISLTREIEKKIHFSVRKAEPTKYWIYRVADALAQISSKFLFLIVLAYMLTWSLAQHNERISRSGLDVIVDQFAMAFIVVSVVSVTAHIVQDGLRRQLHQAVLDACQRMR